MKTKHLLTALGLLIAISLPVLDSVAFCGFYVAKADATLFNNRSEVILVRNGDNTVITMSNDFQGDVKDFAMVVPVPVVLEESDIRVVERNLFSKLDTYSSPRLVEYYDHNPCQPRYVVAEALASSSIRRLATKDMEMAEVTEDEYQVTIEAEYTVGEYDILILSAKESNGLKRWLTDNGYKIPAQAEEVLDPYIKNQLKFFVVKVNLDNHLQAGGDYLRPLQINFESDRFMLPIRLGMANANGAQDMVVYAFTNQGRVECTNYRTVKIPTDRNIPTFVQPKFGEFYKDMFDREYIQEGGNAVFLEYAWNVSPNWGVKCDPCNGPPPIVTDLREAGVDWITNNSNPQVFFTRMHVRYTRNKFPQDLFFQVTPNKENFQGRYVMTHAASGDLSCDEGQRYLRDLENRRKREVDELMALTGWNDPYSINYIEEYSNRIKEKRNANYPFAVPGAGGPWYILAFTILSIAVAGFWIEIRLRKLASE